MPAFRRRSSRSPRSSTTWQLARALGLAAVLAGAGGCLDDRSATAAGPLPPAALAITAQINSADGTQLHVRVSYARAAPADGSAAEVITLLDTRVPLGAGPRELSVDVTRCLGDQARAEPGPFCDVITELELLDAADGVLDRKLLAPLRVRPGERVTAPETVQLFQVATVDVVPASAPTIVIDGTVQMSAVAKDASNREVTDRTPAWSSSEDAVATVDASGIVTGRAAGTAQISAVVGGRTGTRDVVVTPRPAIGISPQSVVFAAPRGAVAGPQSVAIENAGGGTLAGLAVVAVRYTPGEPADWLATPELDATTAPTTLRLRLAGADLPVGSYTAWVVLDAAGAANVPDSVRVTYAVDDGPTIRVAAADVALNARRGSTPVPSAGVAVTNGNPAGGALRGLSVSVELLSPAGAPAWLRATVGAEAPTTLALTATTTDLAPGAYTASVTISSTIAGVAPRAVTVTYTVGSRPAEMSLSSASIAFTAEGGEPLPDARTVTIRNTGDGAIAGLQATIVPSRGAPADWLTATFSQTTATPTAPATLTLRVSTTDFRPIEDVARVVVSSTTPGIEPQTVTVGLDLTVRFASVTAGGLHSCGLTRTGKAYCWGDNSDRQLGDGTTTERRVPVPVAGDHRFASISAGGAGTCGLTRTDEILCWGRRPTASAVPTRVADGGRFSSLTVGEFHACVISPPDNLSNILCWGENGDGQLGDGTFDPKSQPVRVSDRGGSRPGPFEQVSAGAFHTCALDVNGIAYCWGNNVFGQLGIGSGATSVEVVMPIGRVTGFSDVDAGGYSTCGLRERVPFCWGIVAPFDDPDGTRTVSIPEAVEKGPALDLIRVGLRQVCGISGRTLFCWGENSDGEVGNGSTATQNDPMAIAPTGFTSVNPDGTSSGRVVSAHTCGRADGVAYCWGSNSAGQLGNGTAAANSTRPTRVFGQP